MSNNSTNNIFDTKEKCIKELESTIRDPRISSTKYKKVTKIHVTKFHLFPQELQCDKDLILLALQKGEKIYNIPFQCFADEGIVVHLLKKFTFDKSMYFYIDKNLKNKKNILTLLIKRKESFLQFPDELYKNNDFLVEALNHYDIFSKINILPDVIKKRKYNFSNNVCDLIYEKYPQHLSLLSKENFKYLSNNYRNFCEVVIEKSIENYAYLSLEQRKEQKNIELLKNNYNKVYVLYKTQQKIIKSMPKVAWADNDLLMEILKHKEYMFVFFPQFVKENKELCKKFTKLFPTILNKTAYGNDPEIVTEYYNEFKDKYNTFMFMGDDIRENKEFISNLVQEDLTQIRMIYECASGKRSSYFDSVNINYCQWIKEDVTKIKKLIQENPDVYFSLKNNMLYNWEIIHSFINSLNNKNNKINNMLVICKMSLPHDIYEELLNSGQDFEKYSFDKSLEQSNEYNINKEHKKKIKI